MMAFKIKTLKDGQEIFIVGTMSRTEFKDLIIPGKDMVDGFVITQRVVHSVLRRQFKSAADPLLVNWVTTNRAKLVYRTDDGIFDVRNETRQQFDWGFGFKTNSKLKEWFLLKWC